MKDILKLIRVKHWIKNLLIFLPLIFSGNLLNKNYLITTILGFLSFSLAASTIYIINDIKDKDKDKLHEIKKNRPIASGKISISKAIIIAVVLFILSFIFCILATKNIWSLSYLYILIYVLINIGYSLKLKNIPLVDITIIVIGFLLRVIFGASLLNIAISNWLYLTIISVSFYLALGKRRNEIIKAGSKSRTVLRYYTKEFLDKNMYMFLAISIVFYSLWTVDAYVTLDCSFNNFNSYEI